MDLMRDPVRTSCHAEPSGFGGKCETIVPGSKGDQRSYVLVGTQILGTKSSVLVGGRIELRPFSL